MQKAFIHLKGQSLPFFQNLYESIKTSLNCIVFNTALKIAKYASEQCATINGCDQLLQSAKKVVKVLEFTGLFLPNARCSLVCLEEKAEKIVRYSLEQTPGSVSYSTQGSRRKLPLNVFLKDTTKNAQYHMKP